jgi:hypothetical protein
MIADYTTFLHKTFGEDFLNKHYDRNLKEILSVPTRKFPHTRVNSSIHLAPATGGNSLAEYSIVLSKTYLTE